ncbi:MAG TPA: hypothetical protein VNN17_13120 [Terriglobia bacterium]|nr:hypothetical protein [Terriglobia bacterium]
MIPSTVRRQALRYRKDFDRAVPFRHVVIDHFFEPEAERGCLKNSGVRPGRQPGRFFPQAMDVYRDGDRSPEWVPFHVAGMYRRLTRSGWLAGRE